MRGNDQLAGGDEAEALADVLESTRYGEGRGGKDDAGVVVEQGCGEELGDVDGRGLQVGVEGGVGLPSDQIANSSCGATLDPEDGVAVGGLQQEGQMGADVGGTLAETGGLLYVLDAFQLAFETR